MSNYLKNQNIGVFEMRNAMGLITIHKRLLF